MKMHAQDFLDQRVLDYGHFTPLYEKGNLGDAIMEIVKLMNYSVSHRDLKIDFAAQYH